MSTIFLKKIITWLILPLPPVILLVVVGIIICKKRFRLGATLALIGITVLYGLHTPYVSSNLSGLVAEPPELNTTTLGTAQAIVVLGCGAYKMRAEYGQPMPTLCSFERLTYAAFLYKKYHLPVLITGGDLDKIGISESMVSAKIMQDFFDVPVKWQEVESMNTWDNAQMSHNILAAEGINNVIVVTHGWHMRRARYSFEHAGFKVIPGSAAYSKPRLLTLQSLFSNENSFETSYRSLRELMGLLWYWSL